ncbi:hypothetical protein GGI42DRAFT_9559 [Trichoderma sp. SZMC 28013]
MKAEASGRKYQYRRRRSENAQRARATRSLAPAGPASAGRRARSGCFWLWAALPVARLAAPLVACAGRCALLAPALPHCPTYKLPVARFSPPFLLHSSHFAPLPLSPRSHPWGEAESVIANSCIALASCWTASVCASDRPVDDFLGPGNPLASLHRTRQNQDRSNIHTAATREKGTQSPFSRASSVATTFASVT